MASLSSKVALITGGASGLGLAIAKRLSADGARVFITDIQRQLGEEAAAREQLEFLEQDVSDEVRWEEVIQEMERRCGALHILVNNAGILGPMDSVSPENTMLTMWQRIFAVNVEGVFLGCRVAIPALRRAGGGSIINMSSIAGLIATPYATAYGCSKAAVRQLTKSVAQYCAEQKLNICCNSIHPGNVRTALWDRHAEEMSRLRGVPIQQIFAEARAMCPLGDFTKPEHVAAGVAFLASDEARFITGTKLVIDGGVIECESYRPPPVDGC